MIAKDELRRRKVERRKERFREASRLEEIKKTKRLERIARRADRRAALRERDLEQEDA